METKPTLNEYKITARSVLANVTEPFVDWFEASSEAEAIAQWKAQAADCGIEASDIELVKIELIKPNV